MFEFLNINQIQAQMRFEIADFRPDFQKLRWSTRDGSETSLLGLGDRILIYIPRGAASAGFWFS